MERIDDKTWQEKVRPNLNQLSTEDLIKLSKAQRSNDNKTVYEVVKKLFEPIKVKFGIKQFDK